MKKREHGITLVALIITIIVMLILVAITINVALNGGLFNQATDAKQKTQLAADRERFSTVVAAAYNYETGEVDIGELEKELGSDWKKNGSGFPYTFTNKNTNNSFLVYKNGKIEDIETSVNQQNETNFEISLEQDICEIIIHVHPVIEFTEQEAYDYLYDLLGIQDKSKPLTYVIEAIANMDADEEDEYMSYAQVKALLIEMFNIEDESALTDETIVKMCIAGPSYNEYTIMQIMEEVAKDNASYNNEVQSKKIRVNGQEIPNSEIEWEGNNAKYPVTESGIYQIEVELDGQKASDQIEVTVNEFYSYWERRFCLCFLST